MSDTRIKICGLTRRADVDAAVSAGAWALGFVCWTGSERAVAASQIRELTADVPSGVRRVGVVVNPTVDEARQLIVDGPLTAIQLHGEESSSQFLSLGVEVFKAVALDTDAALDRALALPPDVTVLVDAHDPVRRGGTGGRADWARAAVLAARRPVILAGGLRPGNVRDAIDQVGPWAIDVSSGVESAPGIKDAGLITALFDEANGVTTARKNQR